MNKDVILLGVCVLVLAGGGGYSYYRNAHAPHSSPDALASAKSLLADRSHPRAAAAPAAPAATATHPPTAADTRADALKNQADALKAARAPIESALGGLKVSSILLGDPAAVIISKHDYSVGDPLTLPGKQVLKVTGINDAGVALLAADGQTYHLDAPAAPDLAALRKK